MNRWMMPLECAELLARKCGLATRNARETSLDSACSARIKASRRHPGNAAGVFRRLSLAAGIALAAAPAAADYDSNLSGVVTQVLTYTDSDQIYFVLNNQPSTHPSCNPGLFSIDAATPVENRRALLSRLLLAKASGESINIGYDSKGNCSHGYIRVHRVG
jgi:hypothetical protein